MNNLNNRELYRFKGNEMPSTICANSLELALEKLNFKLDEVANSSSNRN